MYKIFSISILLITLITPLCGSLSESDYIVPRIDYSITGLQHVYSPIYKSGAYADFRSQTLNFVSELGLSSELSADEEEILSVIFTDLPNDVVRAGFQHRRLMQQLRLTLSQNEASNPFLDEYVYWLFTQHQLSDKTASFLEENYGFTEGAIEEIYQENPHQFLTKCYTYLQDHGLQTKNSSIDEEYGNDPLLYGDMPFYLYSWNNAKQTKVLRIPNMARDYTLLVDDEMEFDSKVNEEFYHYLKILTQKKQKQLYINLMARRDEVKTGIIENLEIDPIVADSIIVITLDRSKASEFYMQEGAFKEQNDAMQFKNDFYARMLDADGEYYWSKHIAGEFWNQRLHSILEEVHAKYFDNMTTLTFDERVDFIELSYLRITNALMDMLEPDYLNISCKNTIDRGPSLYTLARADQLLSSGKSLDEIYKELVKSLLVPPAALHNRNGHLFRIMRFDSALNRLVRNSSGHTSVVP